MQNASEKKYRVVVLWLFASRSGFGWRGALAPLQSGPGRSGATAGGAGQTGSRGSLVNVFKCYGIGILTWATYFFLTVFARFKIT